MERLEWLRRLREHCAWADELLLEQLRGRTGVDEARQEYAHVLGAEETWLARVEGRAPATPVWPETIDDGGLDALRARTARRWTTFLGSLDPARLGEGITYTNSAGTTFNTALEDILLHVFLHGQYHRGKVNLMLRRTGAAPAPVDYIAFVRGVPAATTPRGGVGE